MAAYYCLIIVCSLSTVFSTMMQKRLVSDTNALCLDGSRAMYYIRNPSVVSTRWVFYLEDGGAYCIGDSKTCDEYTSEFPYFTSSNDKYHPAEVEADTIFSSDASISPWSSDNFVYMSYCSQDGWLGENPSKAFNKYYLRGGTSFKAIVSEVLSGKTPSSLSIVLIGSSSGALGASNHVEWLVNTFGFTSSQISLVLDSFYMPISNIPPDSGLVNNLPVIMNNSPKSSTSWVDGYPCALVYECLKSTGFIPSGIKTLIITSAYDAMVFSFGATGSDEVDTKNENVEDMLDLVSQYVTHSAATVQSAVSMHYDRDFTNSTIFIAGCVQHTYIMPLDPVYRDVQSGWSSKEIRQHVSKSSGKWTNMASFGDIAYIKGSAGPFRWFTPNFAGSNPLVGSRLSPAQYPDGSTLGKMVTIWAKSDTPDIVGDICSDSPQCGDYCNHEVITGKKTPIRDQLFYNLKIVSFVVIVVVVVVVLALVVTDGVHSHAHLVATYGEEMDAKEVLQEYVSHLEAKNSIDRAEKQLREISRSGDGESTPGGHKKAKKGIVAKARAIMNKQYGKRRMSLYSVHSGSNENKKLMQTLPMMDGHPALIWRNVRYLPNNGTSMCFPIQNTCLLNDSWGNFRYGRVTAVMGPSGCGKSTLLKVLGGRMDQGIFSGVHQRHILLGCLELVSEKRDAIGYVSQDGLEAVTATLSVEDNLFYRASLLASLRHSDESIHKHVDAVLERCDLTSKRNTVVSELNKGQSKRLAIAMELLANDSVLFLDDPLLGLDGASALRVMTIIKSEALIQGKCVVMVGNQPRGDIFDLFDDLLLMKNGRTLYCGTSVQFKKKILPQFDEILYDSCGDRIMSHLTQFDDLYLPENFNAKVITADMVRANHANVALLVPADIKEFDSKDDSLMFERISDMMVQFCNVLKDAMAATKHATIPVDTGLQMMIDGRQKSRAQDIVSQINAILSQHDEAENSHVGVRVYERNPIYVLRRFFAKIMVNTRRLWLSHGYLFYLSVILLPALLYPLMSLLLMSGLAVNDVFIGSWFIIFFSFMFVNLSCSAAMANRYKQYFIELEDDIFGCFSIHATFVTFYTCIAFVIAGIAYFSLFIIRPGTGVWEVYDGAMILAMDMFCFVSLIFLCVVITNGHADMTYRIVTALFTISVILGGLVVNIRKFPDYVKFILQVNPIFTTVGTFEYLYVDDCDLNFGSSNFCKASLLTLAGYSPHNEPGFGLLAIFAWTVFVNLTSLGLLFLRFLPIGVFIDRSTDSDGFLSSSRRQHSNVFDNEDDSMDSDSDESERRSNKKSYVHDEDTEIDNADVWRGDDTDPRSPSVRRSVQKSRSKRDQLAESDSESLSIDSRESETRQSSRGRKRSPSRPNSSRYSLVKKSESKNKRRNYDESPEYEGSTDDFKSDDGSDERYKRRSKSREGKRKKSKDKRDSRDEDRVSDRIRSPNKKSVNKHEEDYDEVSIDHEMGDESETNFVGAPTGSVSTKLNFEDAETRETSTITSELKSQSVSFRPAIQDNEVPTADTSQERPPVSQLQYEDIVRDDIVDYPPTSHIEMTPPAVKQMPIAPTASKPPRQKASARKPENEERAEDRAVEAPASVPIVVAALSETAASNQPSSPAINTPVETLVPAISASPTRRKSVAELLASAKATAHHAIPTPQRAPPPPPTAQLPTLDPDPEQSPSEDGEVEGYDEDIDDGLYRGDDYGIFTVEQSFDPESGVLSVVMDFLGNVSSKKEIGLGISDDQQSLNILVAGSEEEVNVQLLQALDASTIKTKFNKGSCTLNISAGVL